MAATIAQDAQQRRDLNSYWREQTVDNRLNVEIVDAEPRTIFGEIAKSVYLTVTVEMNEPNCIESVFID